MLADCAVWVSLPSRSSARNASEGSARAWSRPRWRARALGFDFAVVLGDPAYYGRLGFTRADTRGLACVFSAPPGAFQVLELRAGALDGARGLVRYHPAFDVFA